MRSIRAEISREKMRPYRLLKIYKEAGIKKKKVRQTKVLSEATLRKIRF